ncbi:MAG: ABC-2 type transport system permease component GldF [Bacteroidetes bacterium HLUCCA01]|nr:MAG: ABC-2 type transport system permease component GldF [Bacteroidetes bacterium HLUCCA01]
MASYFRTLGVIWRKELYNYFWSPIAYIVLPIFLLVSGYFFSFSLFYLQVAAMTNAFHNMAILLLLLAPAITMRLLAEENQSGSMELLFTLPVSYSTIILGKYLAAVTVLLIGLAGSLVFLIPLFAYGDPDPGPILAGYLGIFLLGCVYLAVGLFVSSASKNQIVAAVGTTGILIILWFASYLDNFNVLGELGISFRQLSVSHHHGEFVRGIVPLASVMYMLSLIGLFYTLSWFTVYRRRYIA